MSHYSVCVVIPSSKLESKISELSIDLALGEILAPFDESTEDPEYVEFENETESALEGYKHDTMMAIRYPDGTLSSTWDRRFSSRFTLQDEKILERFDKEHGGDRETEDSKQLVCIADCPVSKVFTFEQYCNEYCGYRKASDGRWGFYHNPNAKWDWFQIGGRFQGELLVKEGTKDVLHLSESESQKTEHPDGYLYVNGARMKDIAWEKMRKIRLEQVQRSFQFLSETFRTKDSSKLGPATAITEDGIAGWGRMLYYKDETLEEYISRRGATDLDLHPLDTYAVMDKYGDWSASGDMGWFGISMNDKPERTWKDELNAMTEDIAEDDYVVIVDCHI